MVNVCEVPGKVNVVRCRSCVNGTVETEFGSMPCSFCDGRGYYREAERPLPATNYVATTGNEVIDEGTSLEKFVAGLAEVELVEDVIVWLMGDPVRAVACLKPGIKGVCVTWL